ncbi:hypothetical protein NM688_g4584 [Phlebia brevispora]|uniref:Uncharacterized protein n=1 Tax=Phlebia brevispora TaxID=194682 RepID=A0ACC1T2Q5_9APHY|nr:hypothetical protein NM688_g4584 [Phlebia brevispora]
MAQASTYAERDCKTRDGFTPYVWNIQSLFVQDWVLIEIFMSPTVHLPVVWGDTLVLRIYPRSENFEEMKKKALCIGISYAKLKNKHVHTLLAAQNDAVRMSDLLQTKYGYMDVKLMLDCDGDQYKDKTIHGRPTRDGILKGMHELVKDVSRGDRLVFHFSGHGSQQKEGRLPLKESDGLDEREYSNVSLHQHSHERLSAGATVIWPEDIRVDGDGEEGGIIDNDIHDILVEKLPTGVHLTVCFERDMDRERVLNTLQMIFDCCHSGTMADLPDPPPRRGAYKVKTPASGEEPQIVAWSTCRDTQLILELGSGVRRWIEVSSVSRDSETRDPTTLNNTLLQRLCAILTQGLLGMPWRLARDRASLTDVSGCIRAMLRWDGPETNAQHQDDLSPSGDISSITGWTPESRVPFVRDLPIIFADNLKQCRAFSTLEKYDQESSLHRRVRDLLTNVYGYDDVTLMLDHRDSEIRPTRENILEAMRNLVEDASDGDRLVFHYSGHGSQVECFEDRMESDELDEKAQVIWPEDVVVRKHNQENYIRDNEIHDILVENLPRGVRLTMIFDCCHSGTAADLPEHTHCPTKRGKFKVKRPQSGEEPEVVAWSACQDSQEVLEFKSTGGLLVYVRLFLSERPPLLISSSAIYQFLCECLNARPDSLTYGTVLRTIQSYTTQTYDLKNTNSGTNYETPISDISVLGDYVGAHFSWSLKNTKLFSRNKLWLTLPACDVRVPVRRADIMRSSWRYYRDLLYHYRSNDMSKKALCIGISYQDSTSTYVRKLPKAHEDTYRVRDMLTETYEYDEVTLLIDDDDSDVRPTRENILQAMDDLVDGAVAGDRLVFHYSGHGSQVICEDDDEESDGLDEVIWPEDVSVDEDEEDNIIRDNDIHNILVEKLPTGVHLTMIFDCCHSGTASDLPEHTNCPTKRRPYRVKKPKSGEEPEVVAWSACQDSQVVFEFNSIGGLLVYLLCENLDGNPDGMTYKDLLGAIQDKTDEIFNALDKVDDTPISDISVLVVSEVLYGLYAFREAENLKPNHPKFSRMTIAGHGPAQGLSRVRREKAKRPGYIGPASRSVKIAAPPQPQPKKLLQPLLYRCEGAVSSQAYRLELLRLFLWFQMTSNQDIIFWSPGLHVKAFESYQSSIQWAVSLSTHKPWKDDLSGSPGRYTNQTMFIVAYVERWVPASGATGVRSIGLSLSVACAIAVLGNVQLTGQLDPINVACGALERGFRNVLKRVAINTGPDKQSIKGDKNRTTIEQYTLSSMKKALCVGISYQYCNSRHVRPLRFAHEDAYRVRNLLLDTYGYNEVTLLLDDATSYIRPTRDNILHAMRNLVYGAQPGDRLVFHSIWPEDIMIHGEREENNIIDNEIHDILVESLHSGVHLTMIFDCCHSGTAADLPEHRVIPIGARQAYQVKTPFSGREPRVVAWSACQDPQEVSEYEGVRGGLLIHLLTTILQHKPYGLTYEDILAYIRQKLNEAFRKTGQEPPVPDISVLGSYEDALNEGAHL